MGSLRPAWGCLNIKSLLVSQVVIESLLSKMSLHSLLNAGANIHKKLQIRCPKMQKSHKMKRICSLFRSIVYSIKEKLLSLRSEFHLRRKESLKFSRRQETSTFPDQKHYVKTRRPIAHTRYGGVGIGGIQQSSRWRCARPTVFLLFIQRCFAPLSF